MDKSLVKNASKYDRKEEWGPGEWLTEPGMNEQIEFEYQGYRCVLARDTRGSWCGYTAIPLNSHFSQKDNYVYLNVHGGISWHDSYTPWDRDNNDTFWIGFSCSNDDDYCPITEKQNELIIALSPAVSEIDHQFDALIKSNRLRRKYRTIEFATEQLKSLVDQIKEKQ